MNTIYECLQNKPGYIPEQWELVYNASTEKEAIEWLELNGGGIYRNILHQFNCKVLAK